MLRSIASARAIIASDDLRTLGPSASNYRVACAAIISMHYAHARARARMRYFYTCMQHYNFVQEKNSIICE